MQVNMPPVSVHHSGILNSPSLLVAKTRIRCSASAISFPKMTVVGPQLPKTVRNTKVRHQHEYQTPNPLLRGSASIDMRRKTSHFLKERSEAIERVRGCLPYVKAI